MNKILNIQNIFINNNPKFGLLESSKTVEYNNRLNEKQRKCISDLFRWLIDGLDVTISDIYTDRFGIAYVYAKASFYRSQGGKKMKVITFPNFEKFTDLLLREKPSFTYEELIEAAEQLQVGKLDDNITITVNESKKMQSA